MNDRLSPSGSVKYVDASSVTVSPVAMDWLRIVPTASGVRFGTVTSKLCWAVVPSTSRAVTVTVASPCSTPVTVTTVPARTTTATPGSEVSAKNVSASPSGSLKCSAISSATA